MPSRYSERAAVQGRSENQNGAEASETRAVAEIPRKIDAIYMPRMIQHLSYDLVCWFCLFCGNDFILLFSTSWQHSMVVSLKPNQASLNATLSPLHPPHTSLPPSYPHVHLVSSLLFLDFSLFPFLFFSFPFSRPARFLWLGPRSSPASVIGTRSNSPS